MMTPDEQAQYLRQELISSYILCQESGIDYVPLLCGFGNVADKMIADVIRSRERQARKKVWKAVIAQSDMATDEAQSWRSAEELFNWCRQQSAQEGT